MVVETSIVDRIKIVARAATNCLTRFRHPSVHIQGVDLLKTPVALQTLEPKIVA